MLKMSNPFGLGKTANTFFNPWGQAVKDRSPAPLFDPIGSSAGWYKPGTQMGNAMNKINDPLKIFKSRFGGLLG